MPADSWSWPDATPDPDWNPVTRLRLATEAAAALATLTEDLIINPADVGDVQWAAELERASRILEDILFDYYRRWGRDTWRGPAPPV